MSTAGSSPAQLRRRTINDLSTELKERIVKLAAQQDAVHKEWVSAIKPQLGPAMLSVLNEQQQRNGRSLNALFQVSKVWSELAAPHLFKVLKASRATVDFQMLVMASRCRHFKIFELDTSDKARLTATLVVLQQSKEVEQLHLHRCTYDATSESAVRFTSYTIPGSVDHYLANTLFRLSSTTRTLYLHNFPARSVLYIVQKWAPSLRRLHLAMKQAVYWRGEYDEHLGEIVAAAAILEELEVQVQANESQITGIDLDFSELVKKLKAQALHFPSLRHLSLDFPSLNTSNLEFATFFASTLTSLALAVNHDEGAVQEEEDAVFSGPRFDTEIFPSVKVLSLSGIHIEDTLASLRNRHFPALTRLEAALDSVYFEGDDPNLPALLSNHPHLETLRIHDGRRLLSNTSSILREAGRARNIATFDCPDVPVWPGTSFFNWRDVSTFYSPISSLEYRDYVDFTRHLRDFLSDEVDQAERTGDRFSPVGLTAALRPLELERLARSG